jgi:hypothetical protein
MFLWYLRPMYVCFRKQDSRLAYRRLSTGSSPMYESFRVRRLNARQSHEGLDRDARHEDDSDCDLPVLASFAHLHKVTLDLRYHAS